MKKRYLRSRAQCTVQLPEEIDRNVVQSAMKEKAIPTMVYYMKPMHTQGAFAGTDSAIADCLVTDELCKKGIESSDSSLNDRRAG